MRLDHRFDQVFNKKKEASEEELITLHDLLMVEYGWIPIKEFRELPIPTLINLSQTIMKRKELEKKQYDKIRRK